MATARVTSKGQITIPSEVRVRLGLRPGSSLTFVATDAGRYEIHAGSRSVREMKGSVARPSVPVSLTDMDTAIAGGAAASST